MNIKEIKEMLQLMAEHNLDEVEIEKDGLKIKLRKGGNGKIISEAQAMPVQAVSLPRVAQAPAALAVAEAPKPAADAPNVTVIKSPMVGTYYASPAPDQPPYASVGKRIKEGDVLCIVEAMKLMNEIKSEVSGQIIEILVKNGQPVEFDQPLFKVQRG